MSGLKLKSGSSFYFDSQIYENVIPQDVVDRIEKVNKATSAKNGKLKKGDKEFVSLINLEKHTVKPEQEGTRNDSKSP